MVCSVNERGLCELEVSDASRVCRVGERFGGSSGFNWVLVHDYRVVRIERYLEAFAVLPSRLSKSLIVDYHMETGFILVFSCQFLL